MKIYKHYEDYPSNLWNWSHFTPIEMACRGDDNLAINVPAMNMLEALRVKLGKPMTVNSAYRSPSYNKRIGGAQRSKHMAAIAFDVSMNNHDPAQFEAAARQAGFTGFGFYKDGNFIHIDTARPREWGKRWFKKASTFVKPFGLVASNTTPIPDVESVNAKINGLDKPLMKSKTIWGSITGFVGGAIGVFANLNPFIQLAMLALLVLAAWLIISERIKYRDVARKFGL